MDLPEPVNKPSSARLEDSNVLAISMNDNFFEPTCVEVVPKALGRDVELTLVNHGSTRHAFAVDRLNVDEVVLEPGETRTISIALDVLPAIYECRFYADDGMRGAFSYEGS